MHSITRSKRPHGVFNIQSNDRRGRESNPRIAVLQTATLPLGYPAGINERGISDVRRCCQRGSRMERWSSGGWINEIARRCDHYSMTPTKRTSLLTVVSFNAILLG